MTTLLSSLKLTTRPENTQGNPLLKRRERLLTKLDVQKAMAEALVKGETYTSYKFKWQVNPQTLQREKVKVPKNNKSWFYKRNNQYFLEIRYGTKVLELAKGKQSIDIGELSNLLPTITLVIEAASQGELDHLLAIPNPFPKKDKVTQESEAESKTAKKTVVKTPAKPK